MSSSSLSPVHDHHPGPSFAHDSITPTQMIEQLASTSPQHALSIALSMNQDEYKALVDEIRSKETLEDVTTYFRGIRTLVSWNAAVPKLIDAGLVNTALETIQKFDSEEIRSELVAILTTVTEQKETDILNKLTATPHLFDHLLTLFLLEADRGSIAITELISNLLLNSLSQQIVRMLLASPMIESAIKQLDMPASTPELQVVLLRLIYIFSALSMNDPKFFKRIVKGNLHEKCLRIFYEALSKRNLDLASLASAHLSTIAWNGKAKKVWKIGGFDALIEGLKAVEIMNEQLNARESGTTSPSSSEEKSPKSETPDTVLPSRRKPSRRQGKEQTENEDGDSESVGEGEPKSIPPLPEDVTRDKLAGFFMFVANLAEGLTRTGPHEHAQIVDTTNLISMIFKIPDALPICIHILANVLRDTDWYKYSAFASSPLLSPEELNNIISLVKEREEDPEIVLHFALLISTLSMHNPTHLLLIDSNVATMLLDALKQNIENPRLVMELCHTLTMLNNRVHVPGLRVRGLELAELAHAKHHDNPYIRDVVFAYCRSCGKYYVEDTFFLFRVLLIVSLIVFIIALLIWCFMNRNYLSTTLDSLHRHRSK